MTDRLEDYTVEELHQLADRQGVYVSGMLKSDIVRVLRARLTRRSTRSQSRSQRSRRARSRRASRNIRRSRSRRSRSRSGRGLRGGGSRQGRRKSKSKSKSRSRVRRSAGKRGNPLNSYFNKIFVINLKGKDERWRKVTARFRKAGIKYERVEAVDGRCATKQICDEKRLVLEDKYNVKIPKKLILPAAALTIGTIEILRRQVQEGWERVLICEDDIEFDSKLTSRFREGVEELDKVLPSWDVLYLGCGNECGHRGVSRYKTRVTRHLTSWAIGNSRHEFYVRHPDDLRLPCRRSRRTSCRPASRNLSRPVAPGGTWCYAISLRGAKHMLEYMNGKADDHIDQVLIQAIDDGSIKAIAFDPPIVWHEAGAVRADTDIPW